jgi:hypothetical protein
MKKFIYCLHVTYFPEDLGGPMSRAEKLSRVIVLFLVVLLTFNWTSTENYFIQHIIMFMRSFA